MVSGKNHRVRAVVLAAGQGKRMKSSLPKVLHEVLGKTILSRIIDAIDTVEVEHLHIVVGHEAEQLEAYLKKNPPKSPWTIHVQKPQLGTGHAFQQVTPALSSYYGTMLVLPGDIPLITASTLKALIDRHGQEKAAVSLLTTVVDDPRNYGRIVRDAMGQIIQIVEDKDATARQKDIKEVNPAVYCLEWPAVAPGLASLRNDNQQQEYYLTDLIGWAFSNKLPLASALASDWKEVTGINSRIELCDAISMLNERSCHHLMSEVGVTVEDFRSTTIAPEVKVGADTVILPGCYLIGDVEIGCNCVIGPNTCLRGPVKIGDNSSVVQSNLENTIVGNACKIGPFAHMREGAVIGNGIKIGNFVEVKNSQVGDNTNAGHLSYIGDSQVGSGVNIGAGTITANYDHLSKKKANTIIADGASTGSFSVLVAPVKIGKQAVVGAGSVITKEVPDMALAVARTRQENHDGWVKKKLSAAEKPKQPVS